MKELIARAKAEPGQLTWATVTGATDFVFAGWLKMDGLDMLKVPYRDPVTALNDLSENRIQVFNSAYAIVRAQAKEIVVGGAASMASWMNGTFAKAFEDVDLLASPTSPTVAFPLGDRTADPYAMYLADVCTIPASLAGLPAISIPCGLSDGLPVGLQLAGPAFSENRLFDAAHALEQALAFDTRPPGLVT